MQVSPRRTARVLAAHAGDGAGIDALVPDARLIGGALVVAEALEGDTCGEWVACGAGRTEADGPTVLHPTLGAGPTRPGSLARVVAVVVGTSCRLRAIVVGDALPWGATARDHRVAHLPLRTDAGVAAQLVATEGRPVARRVATLVHVHTPAEGIRLEASVAVADGRVVHSLAPTEAAVCVVTRIWRERDKGQI